MDQLLEQIDTLLEKYQAENRNKKPLYIVVSNDEFKGIINYLKEKDNKPEDYVITSYRDIKLASNPNQLNNKVYLSNELPETGS